MATSTRRAITEILRDDADLMELLEGDGVYFENAPQEATFPFVLVHKQGGGPEFTFGDFLDSDVWVVKGIDRADGADRVDEIDQACRRLLHDAELDVDGYDLLWCRREADVSYTEGEVGAIIHHHGAQYRIEMAPS